MVFTLTDVTRSQFMAKQPIRWGILGTGRMARWFADDLRDVPGAKLVAVGSRSRARAEKFAEEFGAQTAYRDHASLASNPNIDVIYVATPNNLHFASTLLCLRAGKAVLCEKPFAIDAGQAQKMIAMARRKKRFLMEALWTHYLPIMVKLRKILRNHAIGEPLFLSANFGFWTEYTPRALGYYDPKIGGGALMDLGVYVISLATAIFGRPSAIKAVAHLGKKGVDERVAIILKFPNGAVANLTCAIRANIQNNAVLTGTKGRVEIMEPWWRGREMRMTRYDRSGQIEAVTAPCVSKGYGYEAAEVVRCLRAGKLQSEIMTWSKSLADMLILDEVRKQCGIAFPARA